MDEHLHEVHHDRQSFHQKNYLPLHIKELCDEQRPVKRQFYHVVPPYTLVHVVIRVVPPAVQHAPGPWLVPHDVDAHQVNKKVEGPSPPSFTKLIFKYHLRKKVKTKKDSPRVDIFFLFLLIQLSFVSDFFEICFWLTFSTSSTCI